jgi:hypothetical protein
LRFNIGGRIDPMGNPKIAIVAYCLAVGFILTVAFHSPSKMMFATASAPVVTPVQWEVRRLVELGLKVKEIVRLICRSLIYEFGKYAGWAAGSFLRKHSATSRRGSGA